MIGALLASTELITIGALLKIGSHLGTRWLKHVGEQPSPHVKKVRGGRKRALEQTTGHELSVFPW